MDFEEYQKKVVDSAIYSKNGKDFIYPLFGLGGEVGELLNEVKKIVRRKNSGPNENEKNRIKDELGDVLWYLSQSATEFNLSLDEIARENILKVTSEKHRDKVLSTLK